nr:ribonuclease H-like domain-containing protein [Tanacetum cinerariifolium]
MNKNINLRKEADDGCVLVIGSQASFNYNFVCGVPVMRGPVRNEGVGGSKGRGGVGGSRGGASGSIGDVSGSIGDASGSRGGASVSRGVAGGFRGCANGYDGASGSRGRGACGSGGASRSRDEPERTQDEPQQTQHEPMQTEDEDQVEQTQEQAEIDLTQVEQTQKQTYDQVQPQKQPQQAALRMPSARILQRKLGKQGSCQNIALNVKHVNDVSVLKNESNVDDVELYPPLIPSYDVIVISSGDEDDEVIVISSDDEDDIALTPVETQIHALGLLSSTISQSHHVAASPRQRPTTSQHHHAALQPIYQLAGPQQFIYPQGNNFYVPGNYAYKPNAFQAIMLPQAFQTMTAQDPSWNIDIGVSSRLEDNTSMLTSFSNSSIYPSVFVGNGNSIPVTHTEHSFLHTSSKPLQLNHILVTPHIIKNLIYVRKFTRDNDVSVEFDAYGFSVRDYQTRRILLRCDSTGDLYPVTQQSSSQTPVVLHSFSSTTCHRYFGHPGDDVSFRDLVPRPANVNVVRSMWLFKHKFNADGLLSMYKARLVTNERNQHQGIDCDETFSLVVKPATIRIVSSLAVSCNWPIHQLDVKNAFLHGHLSETVYMHQPHWFVDPNKPDYVCHLRRSLYGLNIFIADIASFYNEFAMKDLGSLNYFLGISAQQSASESKLGSDGDPVSDPTLYRSLAGALQYLNFTSLDLSYVVQQVCLYMHDPRDPHFTALKRILRYVRGTLDYGLQLHVSFTTQLSTYTDADGLATLLPVGPHPAEYRCVANVVAETDWIRNLLSHETHRDRHLFFRDFVASGQVRVLHVPSRFQYADIFTKGLPTALFIEFRSIMNVQRSPAHTERSNSRVYELSLLSCLSIMSCHSYLDVPIMSCHSYLGLKPTLFVSINTLYIA